MEWYIQNEEFLDTSSFFIDLFRQIGHWLMKMLMSFADMAETLVDKAYTFLDILEWNTITTWLSSFKPVYAALLVLGIIAFGIVLIVNAKRAPNIVHSILLYATVIVLLPAMIGRINDIIITGKNAILPDMQSSAATIINGNVVDLLYADSIGSIENLDVHYPENNDLTSIIKNMDVTEKVSKNTDGISEEAKNYFNHYIRNGADGIQQLDEFESKGWLDVFDPPWYYRYHIDWIPIYIELIAFIITCLCVAYKVIRLIWEILVGQLLAGFLSTDLTGTQRTMRSMECIRDSYFVLFLMAACVKLYLLAMQYVTSRNFGSWTEAIFILFVSLCVIDGANIIEKILGVDAGLSSGFQKLASTYLMTKNAASHAAHHGSKMKNALLSRAADAINGLGNRDQNSRNNAQTALLPDPDDHLHGGRQNNATNNNSDDPSRKNGLSGVENEPKPNAAYTNPDINDSESGIGQESLYGADQEDAVASDYSDQSSAADGSDVSQDALNGVDQEGSAASNYRQESDTNNSNAGGKHSDVKSDVGQDALHGVSQEESAASNYRQKSDANNSNANAGGTHSDVKSDVGQDALHGVSQEESAASNYRQKSDANNSNANAGGTHSDVKSDVGQDALHGVSQEESAASNYRQESDTNNSNANAGGTHSDVKSEIGQDALHGVGLSVENVAENNDSVKGTAKNKSWHDSEPLHEVKDTSGTNNISGSGSNKTGISGTSQKDSISSTGRKNLYDAGTVKQKSTNSKDSPLEKHVMPSSFRKRKKLSSESKIDNKADRQKGE